MMTFFKYLLAAMVMVAFTLNVNAQEITKEQMEQFKKLPPGQQQTLAKSMGIDYKDLRAMLSGKTKPSTESEQSNTEVFPRGTLFDEEGNPIFP
jgi:polysaccharide export outer membrane protein